MDSWCFSKNGFLFGWDSLSAHKQTTSVKEGAQHACTSHTEPKTRPLPRVHAACVPSNCLKVLSLLMGSRDASRNFFSRDSTLGAL